MTISSDRYGPANFTVRLARLQRIPETLGVEALVLIAGQDGCENLGSARAVSYLLTGRSGRDVLETSSVDADFDDLVMVVRPDALAVYTSQRGYPRIANLALPHSRNLQLITPPSDLTDTDDLEAHKVGSFVQMLRGLKSLAMPVDPDSKDRWGNVLSRKAFPFTMIVHVIYILLRPSSSRLILWPSEPNPCCSLLFFFSDAAWRRGPSCRPLASTAWAGPASSP